MNIKNEKKLFYYCNSNINWDEYCISIYIYDLNHSLYSLDNSEDKHKKCLSS